VYGSLFWNLSNLIDATEPPRVYVGSFWDQPYRAGTFHLLFSEEKADLIHELTEIIPAQALDKKVASLIRRAKDVFVHAIIIGGMRQDLPMLFGKDKAKRKAIDDLQKTFEKVAAQYKMNWHDFPSVSVYRQFLERLDLETFPSLEKVEKEGLLAATMNLIDTILPRMLRPVKSAPVNDPRDKAQMAQLQSAYIGTMENQTKGVQGIQGSSDVSLTGTRAFNFAHLQQQQQQQQQQQPAGQLTMASGTPGGMNPQQQQLLMLQLQLQLQQQQQQQQQLVAQQQQQGTGLGGMDPAMLQQLLALQQQNQMLK